MEQTALAGFAAAFVDRINRVTHERLQGFLRMSVAALLTVLSVQEAYSADTGLPAQLLWAEYTTHVESRHVTNYLTEAPWYQTVFDSSTTVSPIPLTNSIFNEYPPPADDGSQHLEAEAGMRLWDDGESTRLDVGVFTQSVGLDGSHSVAAALTVLSFSPLVDASHTITLNFSGWSEWFFSAQFVRLVDVTLDQELWSFAGTGTNPQGWTNRLGPLLPAETGYQSWIAWEDRYSDEDPRAIASEKPTTDFLATHEYELTVFATTESNPPDTERVIIEVSGLRFVPEPTTFTLFTLGSLALVMGRRRRR